MALFKGISLKMTVTITAAVFATALVLTAITLVLVSYSLDVSLKARGDQIAMILSEALSGRQRQLAIRADVLAQDGDFQTAYSFREVEPERIQKDLAEHVGKMNAALALITDTNGQLVTSAGQQG